MNSRQILFCFLICVLTITGCNTKKQVIVGNEPALARAKQTLDSLYSYYSIPGTQLLRENYPSNIAEYTATYLASEEQKNMPNQYSYLWPYSGTFSAVNALFEATQDTIYQSLLNKKVLVGLEEYFDTRRVPEAYASYINTAPQSDRFYDDNIWLGIDFTDTYLITKENKYLQKAELIWKFIESGTDNKLGGGIYWCEQKKASKNTCSNAPGSVFALKLFQATQNKTYLNKGEQLYNWTKAQLQDSTDYLYFDNIALDGKIGKAKFAYNSGQMMQSAALLYRITSEKKYLQDAQRLAAACYNRFFSHDSQSGRKYKVLNRGDVWFTSIMFRGFVELYGIDHNSLYIDAFRENLDFAWTEMREKNGLFNDDWSGKTKNDSKWLLTQFAMVEMYARLATIK